MYVPQQRYLYCVVLYELHVWYAKYNYNELRIYKQQEFIRNSELYVVQ